MIVLQGMCYAGKTTLGAILARELNRPFLDSRDLFQRTHRMSETEYLTRFGQPAFCEAEKESLRQPLGDIVLSVGGSACYYQDIMTTLKAKHTIVWLNVAFSEIQRRRQAEGKDRPIVFPIGIETFEQLYDQRKGLYAATHHIQVEVTDVTTPKAVVDQILVQL